MFYQFHIEISICVCPSSSGSYHTFMAKPHHFCLHCHYINIVPDTLYGLTIMLREWVWLFWDISAGRAVSYQLAIILFLVMVIMNMSWIFTMYQTLSSKVIFYLNYPSKKCLLLSLLSLFSQLRERGHREVEVLNRDLRIVSGGDWFQNLRVMFQYGILNLCLILIWWIFTFSFVERDQKNIHYFYLLS